MGKTNLATRKINFVCLIDVNWANPNIDPMGDGNPRTHPDGRGYIMAECIKRKLRNRLQQMGQALLDVQSDRVEDGCFSKRERIEKDTELNTVLRSKKIDVQIAHELLCKHYTDVALFGDVVAQKGENKDGRGISFGVRGPISINIVNSVCPVEVEGMQIAKSYNNEIEKDKNKGSDTMGMKYFVRHGLYVIRGTFNPFFGKKNAVTEEQIVLLKEAFRTLFVNDESAARPAGSMCVRKLYWFEHDIEGDLGSCSDEKVLRSVHVKCKDGVFAPSCYEDYLVTCDPPANVTVEEFEGY